MAFILLFQFRSYGTPLMKSYKCYVTAGPGCSKLTTSLVNVSLKFQTVISLIRQYFLLKKCEKLYIAKASLIFATKNSVYLVIKS